MATIGVCVFCAAASVAALFIFGGKGMKGIIQNVVDIEQTETNDTTEKCVICGRDTPYKISTPINQREFYLEGSGQICLHCHYKSYGKNRELYE